MSTMSHASKRVSIRWPPEPANEKTDTLVLSVGGYYVDLRVRKADGTVDWLLAGERIIDPEDPTKVKFTHIIDSNHDPKDPHPAPDVGKFSKLPNGDDLEIGEMPNPDAGGKVMAYEEIWRELNWRKTDADTDLNWILESCDEDEGKTATKKFYAKLGIYYLAVQSVLQEQGIRFAAIRQQFDVAKQEWNLNYTIGDTAGLVTYPEGDKETSEKWHIGDKVSFGNENFIVRGVSAE